MAAFSNPSGLALAPDGDTLYLADGTGNRVRKVITSTGEVTTYAGSGDTGLADGARNVASFNNPTAIALSPDGALLYVADTGNGRVRVVGPSGVTTLAAGAGADALVSPAGIAVSLDGALLFVSDSERGLVRSVDIKTGAVATLAGSVDRAGSLAPGFFNSPTGLAVSQAPPCPAPPNASNASRPRRPPVPAGPGSGPCELDNLTWEVSTQSHWPAGRV